MADYGRADLRLKRLIKRVSAEAPWEARNAEKLDEQTFATWIRGAARTRTAREALATACRAVFAVEPADVSLLHVLFYAASSGGWDDLLDTEGGAQQDRIVGGSQLISLRMAEELGDRVQLSTPVRAIRTDDEGVTAGEVRARRAIVAVPPALAGRLVYDPPLPAPRDQLTQRMPMGSVIKCMAIYDEPFWREDGLTGQATSLPGPAQVIFDNTPAERLPRGTARLPRGPRRASPRGGVRGRAPRGRGWSTGSGLWTGRRSAERLRREGLERRAVLPGLLRRCSRARRLDRLRPLAPPAGRPHPLGRHRDGHPLDGLLRWRRAIREARRRRGHGRARALPWPRRPGARAAQASRVLPG